MSNQKGFTLIEMVVVIVIVAVLAVVAAPRFLNIKSDATEAVMDGIASSFRVVVEQVNYSAIVQGKEHESNVAVDVGGVNINTYFGTPQELWDNNIASLMNSDIAYLGNGYYTPASLTTPCTEASICVVDQTPASRVLPGYPGWGMFFIPRGKTVADKCLAFYVFQQDGSSIVFREVSTFTDGC